ncbi:MAG: hypothetical protein L0Z50_22585 [Verrucomicrobiales bacterium]|nr:hypothetical protein [Verrucomicrobiales bacterium]
MDNQSRDLSCWKKDERAQCLRVETGSGEQYLFPYGYFHEARFSTSGDDETLELLFSSGSRVIRIQGSGLEDLWVALQNLSVACVKSLPQRFVNGGAKAEKNRRFEILVAPVRKSVSFDDVTS